MRKRMLLTLLLFITLIPAVYGADRFNNYRWFYMDTALQDENEENRVASIINVAAEHGLNGLVLPFKRNYSENGASMERLLKIKKLCDAKKIEIIPMVFAVGYGAYVLAQNKNLAEGIPVQEDIYRVQGGTARFIPQSSAVIKNSGFEDFTNNRATEYKLQDGPGEISFIDTVCRRSGNSSLRFENFQLSPHGLGRIMQEIPVVPHKCYRVSCWVRSSNLKPANCFSIQIYGSDKRQLIPERFKLDGNGEWEKLTVGFNSLDYRFLQIYVGVWGGQSGRFWLDDLKVENISLVNVIRRPGTPVTVKNVKTGLVYQEGKDYAAIDDPNNDREFDHDGPSLAILPAGRIRDGETLAVSYYHSIVIQHRTPLCMSEPEVYDIWRNELELVNKIFSPHRYFLKIDEIRAGGSCWACKKRNLTMGQILGDCVTRQYAMIRDSNPNASVLIWSDMLDPTQNAHDRYFDVEGSFDQSWMYIPKGIVIMCWNYKKRDLSLEHFERNGFQTMAAAYYDQDLDNISNWLESLKKTPHSTGIMYTTWANHYDLLGRFGDLAGQ